MSKKTTKKSSASKAKKRTKSATKRSQKGSKAKGKIENINATVKAWMLKRKGKKFSPSQVGKALGITTAQAHCRLYWHWQQGTLQSKERGLYFA